MGRWGNDMRPRFTRERYGANRDDSVATYTVEVDVDVVRSALHFNEALHPDEILKALLADDWGSLTISNWPLASRAGLHRLVLMSRRRSPSS